MRSIYRKTSVTLVTVLALCAVVSASASAAQWYVGGKALTGAAKLAATVKVEEPIVMSATRESIHLVITCTKASLVKGSHTAIEAPGTIKFEAAVLESCKMTGLTGCTMGSEVEFQPFEGQLSTATSPEDSALFKPKGSYFTDLAFNGTCFAAGEFTFVVGKFAMKLTKGQEEKTEQEFLGEGTGSTGLEIVEWGSPHPPVYITGKLKLKLESGSAWSYH
jgi:hypothetical protein